MLLFWKDMALLTTTRVGGVVSETSFKFFIQFVFYTFIFCTFALIVCAIFTAELRREVRAHLVGKTVVRGRLTF